VKGATAGPLWLGDLFDREFLDGVFQDFGDRMAAAGTGVAAPFAGGKRLARLLEMMRDEAGMPAFFFELDACAQKFRSGPPKLPVLLENLRGAGFRAGRTHFSPCGFRTDAPPAELERLFRAASKP
jgi:tRNA (guanine26-N2/guanine27-N2)-dimethyltransferase